MPRKSAIPPMYSQGDSYKKASEIRQSFGDVSANNKEYTKAFAQIPGIVVDETDDVGILRLWQAQLLYASDKIQRKLNEIEKVAVTLGDDWYSRKCHLENELTYLIALHESVINFDAECSEYCKIVVSRPCIRDEMAATIYSTGNELHSSYNRVFDLCKYKLNGCDSFGKTRYDIRVIDDKPSRVVLRLKSGLDGIGL
jgi:hypothetical protein